MLEIIRFLTVACRPYHYHVLHVFKPCLIMRRGIRVEVYSIVRVSLLLGSSSGKVNVGWGCNCKCNVLPLWRSSTVKPLGHAPPQWTNLRRPAATGLDWTGLDWRDVFTVSTPAVRSQYDDNLDFFNITTTPRKDKNRDTNLR